MRVMVAPRIIRSTFEEGRPANASESWSLATERWTGGYASNTAAAYRRDVALYAEWCRLQSVEPFTQCGALLDPFELWLAQERGFSPASVRRTLSALHSFSRHLGREEPERPAPLLARRRRPSSPRWGVPLEARDQIQLVRAAAEAGRRDLALVVVLLYEGWSVDDACAAEAGDLERTEDGRILVRPGGSSLPLAVRNAGSLLPVVRTGEPDHALIPADGGGPLSRHQAARLVRKLARRADIGRAVGPRDLRASYYSNLLEREGWRRPPEQDPLRTELIELRRMIEVRDEIAARGVRYLAVIGDPALAQALREGLGLTVAQFRPSLTLLERSRAARRALSSRIARVVDGAAAVFVSDWRYVELINRLGPGRRLGDTPILKAEPGDPIWKMAESILARVGGQPVTTPAKSPDRTDRKR